MLRFCRFCVFLFLVFVEFASPVVVIEAFGARYVVDRFCHRPVNPISSTRATAIFDWIVKYINTLPPPINMPFAATALRITLTTAEMITTAFK